MSDFPTRTRMALLPLTKRLRMSSPDLQAMGAPVQDYVRDDLHNEAVEALKSALDQVDTVWFNPKNPDEFMCPFCNQVADHIDLLEHDSDCWVKLAQDAVAKVGAEK